VIGRTLKDWKKREGKFNIIGIWKSCKPVLESNRTVQLKQGQSTIEENNIQSSVYLTFINDKQINLRKSNYMYMMQT